MKRFRTRLISFLLAAFMLCMLTTPGFATSQNSLLTHVREVLPYYLLANGIDLTTDDFSISQPYPLICSDNNQKCIVLVFSGSNCIGWLLAVPCDSQYISSFTFSSVSDITSAYQTSSPIAFFTYANVMYLHTAHQDTILSGFPTENSANINLETHNPPADACLQNIVLTKILVQQSGLMARSSATVNLAVPIVENGDSPHTGKGLCWAACVASIGAYKTNTEPLTSVGLYNILCASNTNIFYEHPEGNCHFILEGYEYYNIEVNHFLGGLLFSDIMLFIDNNMPIHATIESSNDGATHGVVICGYQYFPGGQLIRLMDPNNDGYTWVYIAVTSTSFTYVTAFHTYDMWVRRFNEILYYETA